MSHSKVNSSCPNHISKDQVKNPSPKEVLTSISDLDFNPVTNSTQMIKFVDSQMNKKNQTTSFEMEVMCQNITMQFLISVNDFRTLITAVMHQIDSYPHLPFDGNYRDVISIKSLHVVETNHCINPSHADFKIYVVCFSQLNGDNQYLYLCNVAIFLLFLNYNAALAFMISVPSLGSRGNIDIQGRSGGNDGYGGGGDIDILGGSGGGAGGRGSGSGGNINIQSGGGAIVKNRRKHHTNNCNKGDNCHYPQTDLCPAIHHHLEPQIVGPPNITKVDWIWTKEVLVNPTPLGEACPFRKVINTKCLVNHATVDITCDNYYTLYINGKLVRSSSLEGGSWYFVQRWTMEFTETEEVVIAVYAIQDPVVMQQVGLLATSVVWHSQMQPPVPASFITDESWKALPKAEDDFHWGFYKQKFNDGGWEYAQSEGPYGPTHPWMNQVTLPNKTETHSMAWKNPYKGQPDSGNPVPDVPDAKPAKLVTSN